MLEVLATLGGVALAILIFFIVQTLIKAQSTLKKLDFVLMEVEIKLAKLNSFMNTVENLSDIAEKETERMKNNYELKKHNSADKSSIDSEELASWLLSSVKLALNIFKKR